MTSKIHSSKHSIQVQLADRSYPIHIGSGIQTHTATWLLERLPKTQHAFIVFDENVASIANDLKQQFSSQGIRSHRFSIASGETSKSVGELQRIWNAMLEDRTDRGSCVIAVGGGVVGDLAGFAAASFARGIALVQVPTTLLSQVDSSVGGKTGINLPGAKNIVGAFWQPSLVVIDTDSLATLPEREFVSGLAEVVKYGVILLPELFEFLESNEAKILAKDPTTIAHIIAESCKAKAQVVQADERETSGLRAILNYGHTFAHALESTVGYGTLLHGEAVAIGMHMAAILAQKLGRVPETFVRRQQKLLTALSLPSKYPDADPQAMWSAMQHDKKVEHGTLRFILPTGLGSVDLIPGVEHVAVIESIQAAM